MFHGEAHDIHAIQEQAIQAWQEVLKLAKLEHRGKIVLLMQEMIVEKNIGIPSLVKAFEHHVLHNVLIESLSDIYTYVEVGRKSEFFSDRFYDILFEKALNILPNSPSNEVVKLIKVYGDRQDYLKEFTKNSTKYKNHIAQDMDKISMDNLCYMI